MIENTNAAARIEALLAQYGSGTDGASPTRAQWTAIVERDPEQPITLINFFKLRDMADYAPEAGFDGTGQDAFDRYAAVSIPAMEGVGGKFLMVARLEGIFAGSAQDWDLIAIGSYTGTSALLDLFENPDYQSIFFHRTAACAEQQVLIAAT